MNKYGHPNNVAGSGGVMVVFAFILGSLIFIAYRTFYLNDSTNLIEAFALLLTICLVAGIGFVDDILGWKHGGLSKRSRLVLWILSSIPFMVINAGKHIIGVPFFGELNLGVFYALIFIPLGIAGATSTYNFLAGFNGLEAGQGVIILSSLALVSYFTGNSWISVILLCMVAALLAFLIYNFYPAKVFPGNSITYAIGAMIALTSIVGNFEKVAVFFFIPYILETILKSRGKLKKHSFGIPLQDGTLKRPYDRIYGLEHLAIVVLEKVGIRPTEKRVVYLIWSAQIILIAIGLWIFREGIFLGT